MEFGPRYQLFCYLWVILDNISLVGVVYLERESCNHASLPLADGEKSSFHGQCPVRTLSPLT